MKWTTFSFNLELDAFRKNHSNFVTFCEKFSIFFFWISSSFLICMYLFLKCSWKLNSYTILSPFCGLTFLHFFYVIFGTTAIISFFHFDWILLSPVFPRFSLFEKILHFLHYFFNWFGYLDGFILNTVSKSSFRASCGFCISFLCFDLKFTSDI